MTEPQLLRPRDVPLGGLRAITVRRTLPHRDRSFVGAWCFVDHYGPHTVHHPDDGMDVPPHPHTGLQTLSWLFSGGIEHRDSAGNVETVTPGVIALMTAGHGIAHSEVSTSDTDVLHGVQLWIALPEQTRDVVRDFQRHVPNVAHLPSGMGTASVFLGSIPHVGSSPVETHTPLLGAQIDLEPGVVFGVPVDPEFEHGVLLDAGDLEVARTDLEPGDLLCLDPGNHEITLRAGAGGARLLLLGGEPFEEDILMWWNFVGRTQAEIETFREEWEDSSQRLERFGEVPGYTGEMSRIPAPPLPPVRLRARGRRGKVAVDTSEVSTH